MMEPHQPDFVVVGGGVSGCVLARRLADAGLSVLLVEAGSSLAQQPASRDPLRAAELWASPGWMAGQRAGGSTHSADWGLVSEPEPGLGGRRVPLNAGRCLGGGSGINNGLWGVAWAGQQPWASWADRFGLAEWAPEAMAPHLERARAAVAPQPPADHPRLAAFDQAVAPITQPQTASGSPSRVLWCVDAQSGQRVTAADAYAVTDTGLLTVWQESLAVKLVLSGHGDACRCDGVIVERSGQPVLVRPRCEVVLSCGALHTPALLLRSGMGPGQPVSSPWVGQGLITQPSLPLKLAPGVSDRPSWQGPALQPVAPVKAPVGSGVEAACFQWTGAGVLYALCLAMPRARGSVWVDSADPHDPPKFRFNLCTEQDAQTLSEAVIRFRECLDGPGGANLKAAMGGLEPEWWQDGESVEQWVRARVGSTRHPMGSCRMGKNRQSAVCDERGRVFGVRGLRICDNSLVPHPPPDTHVMRVAFGLAERISSFVIDAHAPCDACYGKGERFAMEGYDGEDDGPEDYKIVTCLKCGGTGGAECESWTKAMSPRRGVAPPSMARVPPSPADSRPKAPPPSPLRASPVRFYFTFRSPFAWLALRRIRRSNAFKEVEVELKPVAPDRIFGGNFDNPTDNAYKASYIFEDAGRQAMEACIAGEPFRKIEDRMKKVASSRRGKDLASEKFSLPLPPEDWHTPAKALLYAIGQGKGWAFAEAMCEARWLGERVNIQNPATIAAIADEVGLDGKACVQAAQHSQELEAETDAIVAQSEVDQVFGFPFFVTAGQRFWGNDRLPWVLRAAQGGRGGSLPNIVVDSSVPPSKL